MDHLVGFQIGLNNNFLEQGSLKAWSENFSSNVLKLGWEGLDWSFFLENMKKKVVKEI